MNILCTICCRGGSKGIKNKNIRIVHGKPLMAHTIETAKQWGQYTNLIVSTDSSEIMEVARNYGADVPFARPQELANDTSGKVAVVRHALQAMEEIHQIRYDYVVDLDATSPLRSVADIAKAVEHCVTNKLDIVYSVNEARKNPYFNMVELDAQGYPHLCKQLPSSVLSRQTAPKVYELNASIYVYERSFLLEAQTVFSEKAGIYVMERSAIDIDEEDDLVYLEYVMKQRSNI